ncbi:MAG: hypothetical protein A2521_00980 [Deltaproteobacteria bacterium RIFOXYD12_FULL_57_12]|nr:MAG: hypothetical protein A2521_00980 [Deltaproteobacteria bacterium RIFOXYD12_FULL_57_12]
METANGAVPLVKTTLDSADNRGTFRARFNIGRNNYRVAPGLYGVGRPDREAPVLVTANYKLSFDSLRQELAGIDAWILVLDTRGINVWCAAGKKTFSTDEVINRVQAVGLAQVVGHRRLILPQLAATGVAAHRVRKGCGFEVVWGPIRAGDIGRFLESGLRADTGMRRVTFSLAERLILIPVEVSLTLKPALWVLLVAFFLSGIGPEVFSLRAAWQKGLAVFAASLVGIVAGALVVPGLLPWLPGRSFYLKGILTGLAGGVWVATVYVARTGPYGAAALIFYTVAVSSYLAMNFTGATPYTSPSGVEKEMRRGIPLQAVAVVLAVVAWLGSAFSG